MGKKSTKHINEVMNESVANTDTPAAIEEAKKLLEVRRNQIFIEDDSYIGDPYSLLGQVIEVRSKNGKCDNDVNNGYAEFSVFPIPGISTNEKSIIKQPIKTKSFIVDKKLSTEVNFLNFFKTKLDNESLYSVIVYNQAVGRLEMQDEDYIDGVKRWIRENDNIIQDPDICHLLIVTGVVQKNIISKKYKKFEIKAKGGAYGLSVDGSLYTSTEDYSLDTRFGLSYVKMPIPKKASILQEPYIEIADTKIETNKINDFLSMDSFKIEGLDLSNKAIKSEFANKLFIPNNEEVDFIDSIKFTK